MEIKNIKINKIYKVLHQRKGAFVAQLIGFEEGDDIDPIIMVMKYDVRVGTAQAGLAMTPKQRVRVSGIRPSLVSRIEETNEDSWLREVRVQEEETVKKEPGLLDRLLRRT